jgi:hypothetical protein
MLRQIAVSFSRLSHFASSIPLYVFRLLQRANPLNVVAGVCVLTVLGIFALSREVVSQILAGQPNWLQITFILVLVGIAAAIPVLAIVVAVLSYTRAHLSLSRLVYTFAALILLFCNFYFLMILMGDRGPTSCPEMVSGTCPPTNDIPLAGAYPPLQYFIEAGGVGRRITWRTLALSYADCFHYSVVTGSTVGFGDIHPTRWYAKLLTDLQILSSLGLTVLGVSRYFGRQAKNSPTD